MATVRILEVKVHDNPAAFTQPFKFEIEFESVHDLSSDLEFKVIYVGSSESKDRDQVLDEIEVGPVSKGTMRFVMEAPAPDVSRIPNDELLGVTALLISCCYRGQEFARVGYYVHNEYDEAHAEWNVLPPEKPVLDCVRRNIMVQEPRHTVFKIHDWS
jgi:histone chaperone ASF1